MQVRPRVSARMEPPVTQRGLFAYPEVRARMVDWERAADLLVASFSWSPLSGRRWPSTSAPAWKCFLAQMLELPEFAQVWERHEVRPIHRMTKRMFSPSVGLLQMESTSLWLAESVGVRMVTYTPTDDETRARLESLYAEIS